MDRGRLTPAEGVLLLVPRGTTASQCVQAGLLSLLGAERIRFETSANPFKQTALILDPPTAATPAPLPQHLAALEAALNASGKSRLGSAQVLHALQKRFGHDFGRYVHDEVAPGLIARNLLRRTDSKLFGLFPRIVYHLTPGGEALARPLERLMAAIEQVPSLIDSNPDQALQLVRSAGVLLVMSPRARKQIPRLRKLFADRGEDLLPLTYVGIADGEEPKWDQLLELGEIALEFDMPALFDGLATVGDFTSGGDSSSSDGDGGGGD